ncbi:MAG: hypothetical protein ACLGHX_05090 [Acidimicrobiia bacterium]
MIRHTLKRISVEFVRGLAVIATEGAVTLILFAAATFVAVLLNLLL